VIVDDDDNECDREAASNSIRARSGVPVFLTDNVLTAKRYTKNDL
jgi:hypothetical protein